MLADVISRLDDGRPGAEEAWSMMPRGEDLSAVWTEEMAAAFSVCGEYLENGQEIEARLAFKEKYSALVSDARDNGRPVYWSATLGHTSDGREEAKHEAVNRNRAAQDLPALPFTPRESLPAPQRSALTGPVSIMAPVLNVIAGSPRGRAILEEMKRNLRAK